MADAVIEQEFKIIDLEATIRRLESAKVQCRTEGEQTEEEKS